jgi:Rieske Fe-S protein
VAVDPGPGRPEPASPQERAATRALLERIGADAPVSRRDYLRILVTVSAGLVAGAAGVAVGVFRRHGSGTATRAKVADRLEPGQAVTFRYPGEDDRALAVRLPDGRLVGWSAVCTHLACAVLWREEDELLECPCHDGVFDPATGEVVAGPPPRPLPRVELREDGGGIWAVGAG